MNEGATPTRQSAGAKPDQRQRELPYDCCSLPRPRLTTTTRRKPEVKTGPPVLPFSFPNLDARQSEMRGRMSGMALFGPQAMSAFALCVGVKRTSIAIAELSSIL